MKKRQVFSTLFLAGAVSCVLCAPGRAVPDPTPPEKLTLQQAVEMALTDNPAVRDARERVAAAQARVGETKSRRLLQVSFNGIGKLGLNLSRANPPNLGMNIHLSMHPVNPVASSPPDHLVGRFINTLTCSWDIIRN